MDIERLTKVHLKIRDARSALKKDFDTKDQELKAQQVLVESQLLRFLNENNMSSVRTGCGTIYKQEEITPTGSDWATFYNWVVANDGFDFLERRIKKTAIKEYMEAHEGAIPPGVSVFREYQVRVRRS